MCAVPKLYELVQVRTMEHKQQQQQNTVKYFLILKFFLLSFLFEYYRNWQEQVGKSNKLCVHLSFFLFFGEQKFVEKTRTHIEPDVISFQF